MKKIVRITTVPISLATLLQGQCKFMSQHYEVIAISSGGKLLEEVASNENIRVIPVEMTRKITPLKDLAALWKLYRILRKEKPYIVHSHTPKAGTLGMAAAFLAGVPHRLHTIAGLPLVEEKGFKRKILDLVEKMTYACTTKVYPNSIGLQQIALENNFAQQKKLTVLANGSSNGIDTGFFDPKKVSNAQRSRLKKELRLGDNDVAFVFVGRLVSDKGINELIRAFDKLSGQLNNVKLLLVGSHEKHLDPLLPQTEKRIQANPNILTVGWQQDVRPYLAISDCLVFPSYREGFPNVVMQAGAMGLFGIVSNINGCNEIIQDGINGRFIPVKNEEAILSAMQEFVGDFSNLKAGRDQYRQIIKDRYEREFVWKEILKEYQSLQ
ncbi:glycosyltransferase family 4 protein [Lentiprolixibacter aurantiacus]|uniref:Glycosyltransferase family 4 protein n=1 Tax=Lentiprolixibacter aurantiacus TaxID=2993939 RepID=A0AAE3SNP7_9FLAO|nr:glycosyltransferase family 4 protein [Lentiprolixibacter aurantiacus]MCX2719864.1 glycosyltransferase family 4 protein [Lentiprolixibacter aurantiacus]